MTLQEFLALLEGVRETGGGQYMARCPCHDDKKASLSVRMGEDKIVLQCLAGCQYEDVLRALGVDWKDLLLPERLAEMQAGTQGKPRKPKQPAAAAPHRENGSKEKKAVDLEKMAVDLEKMAVGKPYRRREKQPDGTEAWVEEEITACYEYRDKAGNAVMRVYRTEGKSFPTIHQDGGKWYWGDGGNTNCLYMLPEMLTAIKKGKPIFLVEGEKDVENLRGLGFAATTNKGGAGKWHEGISGYFKGAVVYIVPDLDESGRKHARIVSKALRDVASEVRIVNLRRQGEYMLPDKGDVSDLIAAVGVAQARRLLNELVEQSPVLSRVVGDGEYADFFEGIPGCVVRSACIFSVAADGGQRQLSNFVALPVEQVLVDDGSGQPRYQLTVDGWSATGARLETLSLPMSEFDAMRWPLARWGICANVTDGNGVTAKLRRIIQEAGLRAAVHRTLYCHTGWRKIDGKLCYLHGSGAIGAEDVQVKLDFGLERYSLEGVRGGPLAELPREAVLPACQAATLSVMHVAGLRIGVPVVGFLFLAPLRYFLEQRGHRPSFIPYLVGGTDMGKTTFMSLAMNHYGYDFHFEGMQPGSFDDSAAAMAQKLYELKDMPLFVDDYKRESDPARQRARKSLEEIVIRMIADGMRRSRMNGEMDAQHDRFARGLCIQTGEELPDVTLSSLARLYVIELRQGEVPVPGRNQSAVQEKRVEEMAKLWQMAREGVLNESMRGYIEYLQKRADELPETLEAELDALRMEAVKRVKGDHARMPSAVAYLMLGISTLLDYVTAEGGLMAGDDEYKPQMMERCWAAMVDNSDRQEAEMRRERPTAVFLTTLREVLASGRYTMETLGHVSGIVPRDVIGYKDDDYYYLIPGEAFGAVQKSLAAQGSGLAIGKNSLMGQLKDEKKIIPGKDGATCQQIKRGGIHGRYMVMPRWVLDETEPVVRTSQGNFLKVEDADDPFAKEGGQ